MPARTATIDAAGPQPTPIQVQSLRDLAEQEPEGVYTVTRTYRETKVVLFDAHLDRLEESAALEGIPLELDRSLVRASLRSLIKESGYGDCRMRITIPRDAAEEILIGVEPLPDIPPKIKEQGVRTATVSLSRANPRAKSNAWLGQRGLARQQLPPDVYEGLLVNAAGQILEGFSSNFYANRDSILETAEEHMLMGISRKILLEVIPPSLTLQRQPPQLADLAEFDEAFLTSSSRGVVPIVQINEVSIGDGRPGPITRQLSALYDDWVEDHLEPL